MGENSKTILDKNIVEEWLREIHSICLNEENVTVNNRPWRGKVNKTLAYMTENNLRKDDLIPIILKLGVQNYSYTQEDRNSNFAGEKFWFFGITETMVDCQENLYIKLKILVKIILTQLKNILSQNIFLQHYKIDSFFPYYILI